MRGRYKCFIVIGISIGICELCGCTKTDDALVSDTSKISLSYDVDSYKERLREQRIPVAEYEQQYLEDVTEVADMDYKQLHFDEVVFEDFPETDRLMLMAAGQEEISVEDMLDITEEWLQKIGKADEVDLKSELGFNYVNHPYLEISEDDLVLGNDPEIKWPRFFDFISELKYGSGAFIDRNDCYMQSGADGIYSMSDGKVSAYLNSKGIASDAYALIAPGGQGEEVRSGKTEELAGDSYRLLDGEMSIGEGAAEAEKYFSEDTARIHREGVSMRAEDAAVYRLEDIYYYKYFMRRTYYGIPIEKSEEGIYNFYGGYHIYGESGYAYVADHEGVTAYGGINDGMEMVPLLSEDRLIGVADAAEILSESLASQINVSVDSIELVYLDLRFDYSENPTETIYFPCWCFSGKNRVKGEKIALYVDALTGDVYYYTWTSGEE